MRQINHTTVEDLLTDEGFLHWYRQTDSQEVELWRQWIDADPKNKMLADEAIRLLSLMFQSEKMPDVPDLQINEELSKLAEAIKLSEKKAS